MKLLCREMVDDPSSETAEYKNAIRSVIQCQIQSLIQKLALETGDESIVISTSAARGTYCYFGSYMGKEFLEERDHTAQRISADFNEFCTDKQNLGCASQENYMQEEGPNYLEESHSDIRTTLPAPRRKRPRKQPHIPCQESPPNKRKSAIQFHYVNDSSPVYTSPGRNEENLNTSQTRGSNSSLLNKGGDIDNQTSRNSSDILTSLIKQGNSSHRKNASQMNENSSEKKGTIVLKSIPWIKPEPVDNYLEQVNGGNSPASCKSHDADFEDKSIINRPTSLIPLANIFKKYGTKSAKVEPPTTPEKNDESLSEGRDPEDELPSESSILRSLYERPIYGLDECGSKDEDDLGQSAISLPENLGENIEQFPATTENLVLSGYYDSENYPAYRHSKKHPANPNKKSRTKEKSSTNTSTPSNSGNKSTSLSNYNYVESLVSPSGADLKMKMFESGGRLVYACDVCKRELSHLTSYRRHMKLHTLDRPHKCPVCQKGFIRKYHCIDHINKHHRGTDFDPDTLTLRGCSKSLDDTTVLSDSISVSPSEYNYTLDQSLDESDQSVSLNTSIDQSASSMLSELARSAQKARQVDKTGSETTSQSACSLLKISQSEGSCTLNKSDDISIKINQSGEDIDENNQFDETSHFISQSDEPVAENENPEEMNGNSDAGTMSPDVEHIECSREQQESGAMARKREVTEGIKAIVAHLNLSKKKKMLAENEQPTLV